MLLSEAADDGSGSWQNHFRVEQDPVKERATESWLGKRERICKTPLNTVDIYL
jgi:hypothetical protein